MRPLRSVSVAFEKCHAFSSDGQAFLMNAVSPLAFQYSACPTMYSGVASALAHGYGNAVNHGMRDALCEISCGTLPSSRWNLRRKARAVRVVSSGPDASSARDVH